MKRILLIFLLLFAPTGNGWATNYCNDASVAGCWYMDGAGSEIDRSANGNDLTLTGAAPLSTTVSTTPTYQGVNRFMRNGKLSKNVEGGVLDINGANAKVSLVASIQVTAASVAAFNSIVGKYNSTNNNRQYFMWVMSSTPTTFKFRGAVSQSGTAGTAVDSTITNYALNTRYHVAFVYDGTDLRLYVNGTLACTPVAYTGGIYNGNDPFFIGDQNNGGNVPFPGLIDEVAVFSRALSASEVSDIYNNGISGNKGASDGGYDTASALLYYDAMTKSIGDKCAANPAWQEITVGQSAQGRDIKGIVISGRSWSETILLNGAIHGNELIGSRAIYDFLSYLESNPSSFPHVRWIMVPIVNPDGVVEGTRKSLNVSAGYAVDLNRNFAEGWGESYEPGTGSSDTASIYYKGPSADSEPETLAMKSVISTYHPNKHLDVHQDMNALIGTTGVGTYRVTSINSFLSGQGNSSLGTYTYDPAGQFRASAYANGVESYEYETNDVDIASEIERFGNAVTSFANTPSNVSHWIYALGIRQTLGVYTNMPPVVIDSGSHTISYAAINCGGAGTGVTVNASLSDIVLQNFTVSNCTTGFNFLSNSTLTNSIGYATGDDITIGTGITVTGTYNLFGDAAKAGSGTYSDGGSTTKWSTNPLFKAATDFHLKKGSLGIATGSDLSLTTDYEGTEVTNPPNMGAFQEIFQGGGRSCFRIGGKLICYSN